MFNELGEEVGLVGRGGRRGPAIGANERRIKGRGRGPGWQVWFQNRRAKFRRNERTLLQTRNGLLRQVHPEGVSIEQPIAPRPTPIAPDYLSWSSPTSPYNPIVSHASVVPSTCSITPGQNVHVGSSIANLRLRAKEYSLQHGSITA
ncbi:Paired mesoderm homeobox protein 2 [Branchiostoma belcheri]|nr:Paired mesoderm homeobox protein 2 [Branchiostoma belcheri]